MRKILVSLAILASMGLTACADMGYGYGHHHEYDRGDHRGDGDRHDESH